jgi:hypothetical protein
VRFLDLTHSDTPQSVGLLWTRPRPVAEHTTYTTERHPFPGGFRTHNPSRREATDLQLRPRNHRDRQTGTVPDKTYIFDYTTQTNEMQNFSKLIFNFCFSYMFRTSWIRPQGESMLCFTCIVVSSLLPSRLLTTMHVKYNILHIQLSA